ncbi:hypothetical protein E3P89_03186 [Wallemia ichthyophaga]|uniref:H/ACA ribonucleoprotein complex non-core subunit NAF1 n=1 Tax=Wallemia ichthyophaga TaxID=245174 RepID=A0A4T0HZL0_WALIC|nr:hypothetical protein E3P93_03176 [Wallemia ichthyophaga]TIB09663.1 hypothetical protein E3P90_03207 [Wallemia ichthyophaga]TIB20502.1 hypothetical protein E3P89_03186 [Wallemia ichthyophaga]TIB22085.1 hypothetical protein E3P88_03220 [Wallemia ichthyophaga]
MMNSQLPQDIREILENSIAEQPPDPVPVSRQRQRSSSVSSSSSSSVSSSSSNSSSNNSDQEDAQDQWEVDSNPIVDDTVNQLEINDPDDPIPSNSQAVHTKNELIQHTIRPLPFEKFPESVELIKVGHLHSLIENTLVIQSSVSGKDKTLDQGTLLCLHDGKLLGEIFETFGSVDAPVHSVLIEDGAVDRNLVTHNDHVFYAPQHATIIDTRSLYQVKGSDASNLYDEELPDWQQEHSDDEAEQSAKKEKKAGKKKSKPQQPNQQHHQQRHADDFVDYTPRQRPVQLDYNAGDFNPEVALQQQPVQQSQTPAQMSNQYNSYQFMQMPFNPMVMAQQYAAMQAQLAAMTISTKFGVLTAEWVHGVDLTGNLYTNQNSSFKSLNSAWPAVLSAPPAVVLNTRNSNLNFREMLKPNSDVNYAEVVQRIIIKTDQQASIFLQQKLKSLERPQLDLLVDAVLNRALPLSTNRFGNFLIQRILDVEDISYKLRIVNAISGQIEGVVMNSYGTHVLQKLLATSPEHVKAGYIMNKNVAQGVTHKNASHVWSKALEIKWLIYTPHIMPTVNAAMKGRWVHCANTDTGSLIIQSILGKDGAGACFNEILDNITSCALNKWGSTVVQYLIERASESSLARVTTLLIYSYKQLSVDFYGARCLMACLTMGRKNEYAVELLSRLLLNDAETISIGAQFLVNILSLVGAVHRL